MDLPSQTTILAVLLTAIGGAGLSTLIRRSKHPQRYRRLVGGIYLALLVTGLVYIAIFFIESGDPASVALTAGLALALPIVIRILFARRSSRREDKDA